MINSHFVMRVYNPQLFRIIKIIHDNCHIFGTGSYAQRIMYLDHISDFVCVNSYRLEHFYRPSFRSLLFLLRLTRIRGLHVCFLVFFLLKIGFYFDLAHDVVLAHHNPSLKMTHVVNFDLVAGYF